MEFSESWGGKAECLGGTHSTSKGSEMRESRCTRWNREGGLHTQAHM